MIVSNGVVNIHTISNGRCILSDNVTKGGHHSNTPVHDLSFAKSLDLREVQTLGETQWIEETERCNSTGESITGKFFIRYPSIDWSKSRFRRSSRDFNISN